MHITANVFINADERGLHQDYDDWLEDVRSKLRQAPHEPISKYRHNRTGETCPGQRTGTMLMPTSSGKSWAVRLWWQSPTGDWTLAPGSRSFEARRNGWPGSLDGRRRKRVLVKIIGE